MQEPFIGTIIVFGGNFPPQGWLTCDGSLQSIDQYQALYALIGTTYGGDGQTTFALPDLQSRIPIGQGQGPGLSNYTLGQQAGSEQVTLLAANMPQHSHPVAANSQPAGLATPANNFLGSQGSLNEYIAGSQAIAQMNTNAVIPSTGGAAHNNIMPYMGMNYIIATDGIYPSQN